MNGRERYFAQRERHSLRVFGKLWAVARHADGTVEYVAYRPLYGLRSKRRGKYRY